MKQQEFIIWLYFVHKCAIIGNHIEYGNRLPEGVSRQAVLNDIRKEVRHNGRQ